ncbi:MAG: uroporphyrinogen-III synthase [Acidimicrobiales bacterium]|nr:uroporphyrinogen-III synthase [Acidimicrobiales bacterium]
MNQPLDGLRIVVTRAAEQADVLVAALADRGADVVVVPTIAIVDPADAGAALRVAARHLDDYDWLLLTSTNSVERVAAVFEPGQRAALPLAVVGTRTAAAATAAGFRVELVPDQYSGEGVLGAMPAPPASGGAILFPRASLGRDVLPDGLRAAGWRVDIIETYRTIAAEITDDQRAAVADTDLVTFTSPSTFTAYIENMTPDVGAIASIGPVTTAAIRAAGHEVAVEASPHTIDGLVEAIVTWAEVDR